MLSSIKAVILSGREYTLLILSLLLRICLEGKCLMKDKRFSALYGLEAGKNLKGAVSGYMDNVKTIEGICPASIPCERLSKQMESLRP